MLTRIAGASIVAVALLLAGCGGGAAAEPPPVATPEGATAPGVAPDPDPAPDPAAGPQPSPAPAVAVTPSRIDLVVAEGRSAAFDIVLVPNFALSGAALTVWPTDGSGFLQSPTTRQVRVGADGRYTVTLETPATARADRYAGTLDLILCSAASCTRFERVRSVSVPYTIDVTASPGG